MNGDDPQFGEIDFGNAKPAESLGEFTPIPNGIYIARVTKAEATINKNGNPMVTFFYTIAEGEFAGRKVQYDNAVFTQKSVNFLLTRYLALGLGRPKRGNPWEMAQALARDAVGKVVQLTVAQGEPNDEGKTYPEVKNIAQAPGTGRGQASVEGLPSL